MNKDNKTPSRSERFRGTARRLVKHESQPSRRARAGAKQAATLLSISRKTSISILNPCRAATDTALIRRGAIHFLPDLPPEANPFPWEND